MSFRSFGVIMTVIRRAQINRSLSTVARRVNHNELLKINNKTLLPMAQNFSSKIDIASYEEIKNLPNKPEVLLIDVREPQELIDTGSVPRSINIPLGQVTEKLSKEFSDEDFKKLYQRAKPSVDNPLIFMCKIGRRSQTASEMSRQLGFKNVKNYLGSWEDWSKQEGLSK